MPTEPMAVKGGDSAMTGDDSIKVTMAVPLPPLPTSAPPQFHPDASNWNTPDVPPVEGFDDPPAIDEPVSSSTVELEEIVREGESTFAPGQDNIEAAMHEMAENMDLTISAMSKEDNGPADKQILIRATEHDRERWKRAAEVAGISLSALVRETMNIKVGAILDCSHPPEFRQSYPWSEFCTKCNMRLRG